MKTEVIKCYPNLTKRELLKAKQLIGAAPNLTELDTTKTYQFLSYAIFHCDLEQEGKESYQNGIVMCVDPETGESINISTSSSTFLEELEEITEELQDELEAGESLVFTIHSEPSKNFSGKWYKPVLV